MLKPGNPYVITTCCDAKYGDFLIDHWLASLTANVDLGKIDVVVLDYGLTSAQRSALNQCHVHCFPCVKDGFVCNLRYRDIERLLQVRPYRQVMSVDSGDIIFQADVSPLFELEPATFRAVAEQVNVPFFDAVIEHSDIRPELLSVMLEFMHGKPILNCGMLIGPSSLFEEFWVEYQRLCRDFASYGVDQFAFNYYAYRAQNFTLLDPKFNFVVVSMTMPFVVRNGRFLDRQGELIPIVHNAGNKSFFRSINHFGFGPDRNQRKYFGPWLVRRIVSCLRTWIWFKRLFRGTTAVEEGQPSPSV